MEFETVIFAAGEGRRLGELGRYLPKALLPVWYNNNQLEPIVIRIIRQAIYAKTSKIYIVTHHLSKYIVSLIEANADSFEAPIEVLYQEQLNGEAGGLFLISDINCPILAIDGDNYLSSDIFFSLMINTFSQNPDCMATIGVMEVPDINRYANVKISNNKLIDIIEKPLEGMQFGNIAKMGCYVLSEKLIKRGESFFKDSNGDITTTAAFSNLCRLNETAICVKYEGSYLDIGTFEAYISHLLNLNNYGNN